MCISTKSYMKKQKCGTLLNYRIFFTRVQLNISNYAIPSIFYQFINAIRKITYYSVAVRGVSLCRRIDPLLDVCFAWYQRWTHQLDDHVVPAFDNRKSGETSVTLRRIS